MAGEEGFRAALVRAMREVERLRAKLAELEAGADEPIAIVGIGLRLPGGVVDLASLWRLLDERVDAVGPIPSSRWDVERVYDPDPDTPGKTYVRDAGLLERVDLFDPGFFNITPREAKSIDPQHRLLLEASWEALETAGVIPGELLNSRTGVFIGIGPSDYGLLSHGRGDNPYTVLGTHMSFSAGRVAFTLGLQGPAIAVDTACSSSLVAAHLACASLRAGECELALAGGVQVLAAPDAFIELARTRAVAPDGRCKTFSANADGYGRGEGVVVLALERLSDAKAKDREILALIRGSAVNHDGRSSGITAPNGSSQQAVLRAALRDADLGAAEIDAIECHGTGTSLGDPIEVQALAAVYGQDRPPERPLLLGAIKTNIGHLESAAGLAGVAKVLAAMRFEALPATLHCNPPNPHIRWTELPVEVVDAPRPWPRRAERARRAGVSGFGLSGTNAHLILEEPPAAESQHEDRSSAEFATEPTPSAAVPLLLSGRSDAALRAQAEQLVARLASDDAPSLHDLGYSLARTRSQFERRAAVIADDLAGARAGLRELASGEPSARVIAGLGKRRRKLAVMFTGQGAQQLGMGRELDACIPEFRASLDELCAALDPLLGRSLRAVIHGEGEAAAALLDRTELTQPALFALEVALYRTLEAWGLEPKLLLGHSIGELAAAHVAGVFSLADACKLVVARGRLMQALPAGGAMISVQADEQQVRAAIAEHVGSEPGQRVDVAAVNGPLSTVISGDEPAVEAVAAALAAAGRKTKRLAVSHAFHSARMDPMLAEFRGVLASLRPSPAKIPIVSNLTGELATKDALTDPEYWVRHVREAVRFYDGVRVLERERVGLVLELGPRGVLSSMAAGCLSVAGHDEILLVPSLRKDRPEREALAATLATLHCAGQVLDWARVFAARGARRVALPTYPFQRERYWIDPRPGAAGGRALAGRHALSGARVDLPSGGALHITPIGPALQPYLRDHVVYDHIVVPGAFHLAVLLAVAESRWPGQPLELRDVEFIRALTFADEDEEVALHVVLEPGPGPDELLATVLTRDAEGQWITHASARLGPSDGDHELHALAEQAREADARAWAPVGDGFDDKLRAVHIDWGPQWWWLREVCPEDELIFGRFAPQPEVPDDDAPLPGGLVDNSFALVSWALERAGEGALDAAEGGTPQLPFALDRVIWLGVPGVPRYAALRLNSARAGESTHSDIVYLDGDGRLLALAEGFTARSAPIERFLPARRARDLYRFEWRTASTPEAAAAPPVTVLGADPLALGSALDAEHRADLDALLDGLEPDATPRAVLATIAGETPRAATVEALALLQRWGRVPRLSAHRLVFVTRRALACGSEATIDLALAPVPGLLRSALAEASEPERGPRLVDLDGAPDSLARLAEALASDEPELAIRAGALLVPRLVQAPVSADATSTPLDGAALITGATGALGSTLARHLVRERGVRRLLLLSRRGEGAPGAQALLAELRELGAEVSLHACDVADRDALERTLNQAASEASITSVFHTAGVVDDGLIDALDEARVERVFAAKLDGARNLHELTAGLELEAFVLFSSLAGTLGSAGQGNYAAANAYLDALCEQRRRDGLPGTSLAWGPFAEHGMAARLSEADRARMARQGLRTLSLERGMELLDAALELELATLIPVDFELAALAARDPIPPVLGELVRGPRSRRRAREGASLDARLAALPEAERELAVRELVAAEIAGVLGLPDPGAIGNEQLLHDLGVDSLMAVDLRNRLQSVSGLRLSATLIFDHPTVTALARALLEELGETLEQGPARSKAATSEPPRSTAGDDELDDDAIAVVAMACRYPGGVRSPEQLWTLLEDGVDAISKFPVDRGWPYDLHDPDPHAPGKSVSGSGGFLYDAADFDPGFFGISPREALSIDPQQRLLLETSWEAFERAGLRASELKGSATGVFVGVMYGDYGARFYADHEALEGYVGIGSAGSVASGRISYTFGLEGPAVSIDTACSSSLVAVHLACRALRNHECELALAGGATVMATPATFIEFSRQGAMSPDGRCKAFSDAANGVGWSEGVGLVLLERLSTARAAGRKILAIIRGSAVNQDGRSQGLTAPNGPSQQRVIRAALADAKLGPEGVELLEAHGTGTRLGDPIEAQALLATYGRGHSGSAPLWLGSVKSNIGHTQAAAGVAGIIKLILAMQRGAMPRSLHADTPTAHVDWSSGALVLLREARPWPKGPQPRRGAVSSFGVSGTNAHVILEEPPASAEATTKTPIELPTATSTDPLPLLLSGRSPAALRGQAERLRAQLDGDQRRSLPALARALATARTHFEHRAVLVVDGREQALEQLAALAESPLDHDHGGPAMVDGRLAFVFPGQGSQWPDMARALLERSPVFAAQIERCAAALDPHVDWSLLEVLRQVPGAAALTRVDVVQPVLWAVMVALAEQWRSYGVSPDLVVGHSQGEIAAAYVAGALSLEDAAKVVALRSRVITSLSGTGAMAATNLSADELSELIAPYGRRLALAVDNGPTSTAISGEPDAVGELVEALGAQGRFARRIDVDYASHCAQVEPIREQLLTALADIRPRATRIPMISTIDGSPCEGAQLDADYWFENLRRTVRFSDAVKRLLAERVRFFVEISPHPVMPVALTGILEASGVSGAVIPTLRRDDGGVDRVLRSLGELHARGYAVDWATLLPATEPVNPDELPTYAFERHRFWLDPPVTGGTDYEAAGLEGVEHPLLDAGLGLTDPGERVYTGHLSPAEHPWLQTWRIADFELAPSGALLDLVLAVGARTDAPELDALIVERPLALAYEDTLRVQLRVAELGAGRRRVTVHARSAVAEADEPWTSWAEGFLRSPSARPEPELREWAERWPPEDARELVLAPRSSAVEARAWALGEQLYLELRAELVDGLTLPPAWIDATFDLILQLRDEPEWMLSECAGVRVHALGAEAVRVRVRPQAPDDAEVDAPQLVYALELVDESGRAVASVDRLTLRPAPASELAARLREQDQRLYALEWAPVPRSPAPADAELSVLGDPQLAAQLGATSLDELDPRQVPDRLLLPMLGDELPPAEAAARLQAVVDPWRSGSDPAARLFILTRGAVAVGEEALDPARTALWGVARGLQAALEERSLSLIDLDDDPSSLELVGEALASGEQQLAVRRGQMSTPRLRRRARRTSAEARPASVLLSGASAELRTRLGAALRERGSITTVAQAEDSSLAASLEALAGPRVLIQLLTSDDALGLAALTARIDEACELAEVLVLTTTAGLFGAAGPGTAGVEVAAREASVQALAASLRARGRRVRQLACEPWDVEVLAAALEAAVQRSADAALVALDDPARHEERSSLLRPAPGWTPRRVAEAGSGADLAALATLSGEQRTQRLLALVRRETAAVLRLLEPVDAEQPLQALGLDSLMAVELRNRLSAATELDLAATLFLEHGTPLAVARYLDELLPAGLAPAPGRAAAKAGEAEQPRPSRDASKAASGDTAARALAALHTAGREIPGLSRAQPKPAAGGSLLMRLVYDAIEAGATETASQILYGLAKLRDVEAQTAKRPRPAAIPLTAAPAQPATVQFYCIPSLAAPSTPLQFARIAPLLARHALVSSVSNPGYGIGERMVASREEILAYHVEAVGQCRPDLPLAVLGYSAGGWVAADLVDELERRGRPAAALIILDTPGPAKLGNLRAFEKIPFISRVIGTYLDGNSLYGEDELICQLSAMLRSLPFYESWTPERVIETPTLYVETEGGIPIISANNEVFRTAPLETWQPHLGQLDVRTASCDHFEMIAEQVDETATLVIRWLTDRMQLWPRG